MSIDDWNTFYCSKCGHMNKEHEEYLDETLNGNLYVSSYGVCKVEGCECGEYESR